MRFVAQRAHTERLVSLKKRDIKLYLLSALPKRTFLTGNPARRCAVSLSAALAP